MYIRGVFIVFGIVKCEFKTIGVEWTEYSLPKKNLTVWSSAGNNMVWKTILAKKKSLICTFSPFCCFSTCTVPPIQEEQCSYTRMYCTWHCNFSISIPLSNGRKVWRTQREYLWTNTAILGVYDSEVLPQKLEERAS